MSSITADLVFTNGACYTVDAAGRWAQAVAVRDGRIAAVGTDAELRQLVGPGTEVVDLDGRMLIPGFQDAHVHPVGGGLQLLRCDLSGLMTAGDYLRAIGEYADQHPADGWIRGGGWAMEAFPGGTPTAEVLDKAVADRPAYLPNRDHHSAWVNTRALELAGVTRQTPDPADGRIERDAAGHPTGALHEGAMNLVARHLPADTLADLVEALRVAQRHLHSLGVTAWQDALIAAPGNGEADSLEAYRLLAGNGALTARVRGALWWDRDRGAEQIPGLIARRDESFIGRFSAPTVKIMQDGVCETFTAAVLEPYLDGHGHPTDNRGISFIEAEALKGYVTRLDAAGFQVHFHALAERAVREALDAVEAARRANGPNDLRHHLAHIQIVHPADLPRFRRLGATGNAQPLWAAYEPQMTELTIPFLGEERAGWQYPFGSLERSGAQLAFGSDWPVTSADPILELHVAVNRRVPTPLAEPGSRAATEAFLPAQALTLGSAIRAFTMGSAYVNHLDRDTGSIEVGKYADLAVLDRDLFAQPADEIGQARVQLTLVEGRAVYEAEDFR
jgi:predicted amidohydrolase YtcJ